MGFAFNRLNRLKYYEKIFSEETELYLFTTDKYKGKEKGRGVGGYVEYQKASNGT